MVLVAWCRAHLLSRPTKKYNTNKTWKSKHYSQPRLHTRPFAARRALPRSVVDSRPSKGEDQNCDLFTGNICPSGLEKNNKKKTVHFWQQDEKMTQRNNVGEWGKGKPRESWQTTGRLHVWPSADGQTRPSQTRLGARRCHLGQWNRRRGARRMSAPIHFASSCCQRSGAWRHKQRQRQRKMRACGGHPGHDREALEEQRLWGDKRKGEDEKKSCFSEGNFGVFFHWHSGDGTRGPNLWVGKSVNLARQLVFNWPDNFREFQDNSPSTSMDKDAEGESDSINRSSEEAATSYQPKCKWEQNLLWSPDVK